MVLRMLSALVCCAFGVFAHPMGNFSVSHYARIEPGSDGVSIRYVLDLAEIPTFELLQKWGLDAAAGQAVLERHAARQAREWVDGISVRVNGAPVRPRLGAVKLFLADGAANLPVIRVVADLHIASGAGTLEYADHNYEGRAGWKEIVIRAGHRAALGNSAPAGEDRSRELTVYPQDPNLAPPQDLQARVAWTLLPVPVSHRLTPPPAAPAAAPSLPAERAAAPPPAAPNSAGPGMVARGDYLSRLLHRTDIGWGLVLLGMAAAFGLGAMHALSPGHGKTIVAAYLVGSRGTFRHAALLGAIVTFTHTVSVFLLGFVTLFLSRMIMPEKLYPVLGAISGLTIVFVGATLLVRRLRARHVHPHHHDHHHDHTHPDGHHDHHHHAGGHTHVPAGDITLGSLIALGASGGLVPCPSALVLLLSSVSLGRAGLGLVLLVGFSAGLAVVLTGIGVLVLYARHLLPDSLKLENNRALRLLPALSAAFIMCVGLVMTGVALAR